MWVYVVIRRRYIYISPRKPAELDIPFQLLVDSVNKNASVNLRAHDSILTTLMPEGNQSRISGVGVGFVFTRSRARGEILRVVAIRSANEQENTAHCLPALAISTA